MSKILITGVNGFIGKHIAKHALDSGDDVIGVDLGNTSDIMGMRYYQRNLLTDDIKDILKKEMPSIVIHCAGVADVGYSVQHPETDFYANVAITRRLLFAVKEVDVQCRIVYLSSAGVYGQPDKLPIYENTELNPMSPYALHKKMAEDACIYCVKQYGMDVIVLRIFSAYGPGLKKQLFWDMGRKMKESGSLNLFGTGKESRDYIYIDDLVHVIIDIIGKNRKLEHVVYNVANGVEITIRQAAQIFAKACGCSDEVIHFNQVQKEGNPVNWKADVSRIEALGYKQQVTIEQGIENYVNWLRNENREE